MEVAAYIGYLGADANFDSKSGSRTLLSASLIIKFIANTLCLKKGTPTLSTVTLERINGF